MTGEKYHQQRLCTKKPIQIKENLMDVQCIEIVSNKRKRDAGSFKLIYIKQFY